MNGEEVLILPGQFVTGRKKLSTETSISESKIQRGLKLFETCRMIEQQTTSRNRVITVVNWDLYQDSEQQMNSRRTTNEQPVNTNKKERKKESNKKTYSNEFESCWKIYPKRNGAKQGKLPASNLFEKLQHEDKKNCYRGIQFYSAFCNRSDQPPKDFERFLKHRIFDDYQKQVVVKNNQGQSRPVRSTVE